MKNTASILAQAKKICQFCKGQKEIRGKVFTDAFEKIRHKMEAEFLAELADTLEYMRENPDEFRPPYTIKKRLDNFFEVLFSLAEKRIIEGFVPVFSGLFKAAQAESLKQSKIQNWNIYISSEETRVFARNKAAELVSHISETTRAELKALIAESWDMGDTLPVLTEKITRKFSQFNAIRSALIAQQETSIIYENGKKKGFETAAATLGVTGWKKAITQGDLSVRDSHTKNALDGWIANDELFSGTGHDVPPFGFWCRCTVVRKLDEPSDQEKLATLESEIKKVFTRQKAVYLEAKRDLDTFLMDISDQYDVRPLFAPLKFLNEKGDFKDSGIKRIAQKSRIKGFDAVNDINRGSILADTIDEVKSIIAALEKEGYTIENRFLQPTNLGYMDAKFIYTTKNGIKSEVQIHIPAILVAKEGKNIVKSGLITEKEYNEIVSMAGVEGGLGHQYYEEYRVLDSSDTRAREIEAISQAYYRTFLTASQSMNKQATGILYTKNDGIYVRRNLDNRSEAVEVYNIHGKNITDLVTKMGELGRILADAMFYGTIISADEFNSIKYKNTTHAV